MASAQQQFGIAAQAQPDAALATAGLVVSQGVFDSSANALFIVAAHHGLLSEVSVVSALYPAPTVVLHPYLLASANAGWRFSKTLEVYARTENAFDAHY